jgi:O-antigen ligase
MLAILVIHVFLGHLGKVAEFAFVGMTCLLYLLIGSLSREAILGIIIFIIMSIFKLFKSRKIYAISFTIALLALGIIIAYIYRDWLSVSWSTKLQTSINSIIEGDLDTFSSGRMLLYKTAISDLSHNPILGTGFHGFQLYNTYITDDVIATNHSPHNQYLTAIWKMGLWAGIFYLLFLYTTFKKLYALQRRFQGNRLYSGL